MRATLASGSSRAHAGRVLASTYQIDGLYTAFLGHLALPGLATTAGERGAQCIF
jgi:hypothetical protein